MPSGAKAVIEIPQLGMLALANLVPDDLAELARQEIAHELGVTGAYAERIAKLDETSEEDRKKAAEITTELRRLLKWLVAEHMLVEPRVSVEDLSSERFPLEDLDWLYGVATRRVDEDALGRRLGVARLDEFATFRQEHDCPPDCGHCLALVERLSTADMGSL
jgi:hypothetical protein